MVWINCVRFLMVNCKMKTLNTKNLIRKSYLKNLHVPSSAQMDDRILGDAFSAMEESIKTKSAVIKPNIWRKIMKSRITKFAVAAVIIIAVLIGVNRFGGPIDMAKPAHGITEALNLFKNAETIHIHGWAYLPMKSNEKQEFVRVPFEHWFDLENGCYKIIKPGGIDENSGKPKYFTTISDGEYIMSEVYNYPLEGEPYKGIRFRRLTEFQGLLQTHNTSYNFLMQMFGGLDKIKGFVKMGSEKINGVNCDIWEGAITTPSPKEGMKARIKGWLSPNRGELHKVKTWRKPPNSKDWIVMYEIDQIELDAELPAGIFRMEPPEGTVLENTKENAPFAELGAGSSAGSGDLMLRIYIGFTLSDGSVIICWRGTDKSQPVQDELFNDLKIGGALPKLPLEIEGLKPISNIDIKYNGYHLTHTKKDGKLYEWSIYVPEMEVPSRSSIVGYQVLHRYNVDATDKIVGSLSVALHEDIQITTEEDFDIWVLGAMNDLSDDLAVPDNITFGNILQLAEELRASTDK